MAKAPAFQFYASDFLTDTQSWDIEEVGIYIRLLSNQWLNKGLPNDKKRLARIAGCDDKIFKKAWVILGFKFLLENDGFLRNPKIEETRNIQKKFSEKQQKNGLKGGRPRKGESQTKPKINPNNKPKVKPNESSSSSVLSKDNTTEESQKQNTRLPLKGTATVKKFDEETKRLNAEAFARNYGV